MGGKDKKKRKGSLVQWVHEMISINLETDRACPLIAVELVNDAMQDFLEAIFRANNAPQELQNNLLTAFAAPLYSFAMRVAICRAFGLLPAALCEQMTSLRKIRNHCGHAKAVVSLDDEEIQQWVRALQDFVQVYRNYKRLPRPRKAIEVACDIIRHEIYDEMRSLQSSSKV
ncbi:MAG TPA: hypothetical protein VGN12_28285 [Pirellulales bacterium]|jgi:DNA-binding MltR family transcriptional regulator